MTHRELLLIHFLVLGILLSFSPAHSAHAPHSSVIGCSDCHGNSPGSPFWSGTYTPNPALGKSDTIYNNLCKNCHRGTGSGPFDPPMAPSVKTHADIVINGPGSDRWSIECRYCHSPHYQSQYTAYNWTGDPSLTLMQGTLISASWSSTENATTLVFSNNAANTQYAHPVPVFKSGWNYARLTNKSGANRGAVLFPDRWNPDINFVISTKPGSVDGASASIKVVGNVETRIGSGLNLPSDSVVTYGQLVKDYMTPFSGGDMKEVRFFDSSGPSSFAYKDGTGAGDSNPDGVCQVCHTNPETPLHWQANGTGSDHHSGENCTQCHKHAEGFKASCDVCHGAPPLDDTTLAGFTLPSDTGSMTAGAHERHSIELAYPCEACHYNSAGRGPTHENTKVTMGFSPFNGAAAGGTYNGQASVTYEAAATSPATSVSNSGAKTCANVYCHGDGTSVSTGSIRSTAAPAWDGGALGCDSCHGYGPSYDTGDPKANSHYLHSVLPMEPGERSDYTCNFCHSQTTADGATISNASTHVNRSYNVNPGAWASFTYSYSSAGGTCENNYCHSNVQPNGGVGGPDVTPSATWGATYVHCGSCHKKAPSHGSVYDTDFMDSGGHTAHRVKAGNYYCTACHDLAPAVIDECDKCHSGIGQRAHVNGQVDIAFITIGGRSGTYSGTPAPGDGYGTCTSTYCHGDSITPSWGSASGVSCSSCHSANNALAGGHALHYGTSVAATGWQTSNASTAANHLFGCGTCHSGLQHINGPRNGSGQTAAVEFAYSVGSGGVTGGSYSPGAPAAAGLNNPDRTFSWTAGTCANTYCHSNGAYVTNPQMFPLEGTSPKWDGTSPDPQGDATICNNCHWWNIRHDAHEMHVMTRGIACDQCHADTVDTCSIPAKTCNVSDKAKHVNGIFDVSGSGFTYTYRPYFFDTAGKGGQCSSNQCHSDMGVPADRTDWTYNHFASTISITRNEPLNNKCEVSLRIDNDGSYGETAYTYSIDWGDGYVVSLAGGIYAAANHGYLENGTYTITWSVRDSRLRPMAPPYPAVLVINACN